MQQEEVENQFFGISFEKILQNQEVQQIRSYLTANIVTIVGFGLIFGIYMLVGEYLSTLFFTVIFAIALSTIKKKILIRVQDNLDGDKDSLFSKYKLFYSHAAKFSLFSKIVLMILRNTTSLSTMKNNLFLTLAKVQNATIIPQIFALYFLCIKCSFGLETLILDLAVWVVIDFFRVIKYIVRRCSELIKNQVINRDEQKIEEIIKNLKKSNYFNQGLFCLLIVSIITTIPIATIICYSEFRTLQEDTTPVMYKLIDKFNLTDLGLEDYFKPEFIIGKLEGQYITPEIAEKLYKYNNIQNDDDFISVLYGSHRVEMKNYLHECKDSWFCQTQVVIQNYSLLTSDVHLLLLNLGEYITEIAPRIQGLLYPILHSLSNVFEGSMSFLFKFTLFYQGVLYLLSQSNMKFDGVIIGGIGKSIQLELTNSLNQHIAGVFVALGQIFLYHFMLSYVLLDVLGIQLAFTLSIIVGVLSLTQLISPFLFFFLVVAVWYLVTLFVSSFEITQSIQSLNLLRVTSVLVAFLFESGQIYSTCFSEQFGDPFWIGMSVILGYISFEWKGIIFGPLLIGFIKTLWNLLQSIRDKSEIQRKSLKLNKRLNE